MGPGRIHERSQVTSELDFPKQYKASSLFEALSRMWHTRFFMIWPLPHFQLHLCHVSYVPNILRFQISLNQLRTFIILCLWHNNNINDSNKNLKFQPKLSEVGNIIPSLKMRKLRLIRVNLSKPNKRRKCDLELPLCFSSGEWHSLVSAHITS